MAVTASTCHLLLRRLSIALEHRCRACRGEPGSVLALLVARGRLRQRSVFGMDGALLEALLERQDRVSVRVRASRCRTSVDWGRHIRPTGTAKRTAPPALASLTQRPTMQQLEQTNDLCQTSESSSPSALSAPARPSTAARRRAHAAVPSTATLGNSDAAAGATAPAGSAMIK